MAANLSSDYQNTYGSGDPSSPSLRDYRHASKLFVADSFRLVPKFGFLFYVYFDINPAAANSDDRNPNKDHEIGMLVKTVALPKFKMDIKKYNAYNRVNIAQTKVGYDPLSITFHDDSADVVRNFWFDYFHYYYRDSDYSLNVYQSKHKYEATRLSDKWGYSPRSADAPQYLNSIRIYSLSKRRFSEYILVNPTISSFRHGDHQQGQNETLQHDMTVDYEAVIYQYGDVSSETINGFAQLHYDLSPSPLSAAGGGTPPLNGPGSAEDPLNDFINNLAENYYRPSVRQSYSTVRRAGSMSPQFSQFGLSPVGVANSALGGINRSSGIFIPSIPGGLYPVRGKGTKNIILGVMNRLNTPRGWLSGAVGLATTIGQNIVNKSREITSTTATIDDQYPESAYTEFPDINDELTYTDPINETFVTDGEDIINDQDSLTPASNQGENDPDIQLKNAQRNVQRLEGKLNNLQIDRYIANDKLANSQETADAFRAKYDEAVATYGADSVMARDFNNLIVQELEKQSELNEELDHLTEYEQILNDKLSLQRTIIDGSQ